VVSDHPEFETLIANIETMASSTSSFSSFCYDLCLSTCHVQLSNLMIDYQMKDLTIYTPEGPSLLKKPYYETSKSM